MRCLVTGCAGFIGSHLSETLIREGHSVLGIDCFTDYYPKKIKQSNLSGLRGKKGFKFAEADLASSSLLPFVRGIGAVFHLAAQPGVRASWGKTFSHYVRDNIVATQRLLEAVKAEPINRFVYACYDEKTRALTKEGALKDYEGLHVGDEVLSLNPVTEALEWKRVSKVHHYRYKGRMIHFSGRSFDVLVTPNHSMLIESPTNGRWRLKFEEASAVAQRSTFRFAHGLWSGIESDLSDALIYLVGLYIGDGYASRESQIARTGLRRKQWLISARDSSGRFLQMESRPIAFPNNRSRLWLAIPRTDKSRVKVESALRTLRIKWNDREDGTIDFFVDESTEKLLLSCGKGAREKHVPRWLLDLPPAKLRFLLQGILDSDGDRRRNIVTSSSQLVVDLAELATKLGGSISFREYQGKRTWITDHWANSKRHYRLSVRWVPKWSIRTREKVQLLSYEGIVWCPEVEDNHNLLIERNGKFVFSGNSSSSIYGDSERMPTSEEATPNPVSPYGATKLAGEGLCHVYFRNYGVPVVRLRYFTVYGPRQRPDMAFSRFISAISAGNAIEVFGDGTQKRDFTFVKDIVAGTILALNANSGTTYNVGAGRSVPLSEVISTIEHIIGKKAKVRRREAALGDVRNTSADIGRISRDLGYKPRTSLADGLRQQVDYQVGSHL